MSPSNRSRWAPPVPETCPRFRCAHRESFLKLEHLRVVRRNDQDVVQPDRRLDASRSTHVVPDRQYFADKIADGVGLLRRRALIAFMLYRKVSKSSTFEPTASTLSPGSPSPARGLQAAFVEHLRVECANERMQSPSLREKKTAIRRNGSVRSQDMIEGRDAYAVGMASLYRLLELTRIPQQYDAFRCLGNR